MDTLVPPRPGSLLLETLVLPNEFVMLVLPSLELCTVFPPNVELTVERPSVQLVTALFPNFVVVQAASTSGMVKAIEKRMIGIASNLIMAVLLSRSLTKTKLPSERLIPLEGQ